MRQTFFYSVVLALAYFSPCLEGLQCYNCGYIQGIDLDLPPGYLDPSCKNETTPKDSLTVACEREDPFDPVCVKVHVEGKTLDEADAIMTLRGCMPELIIPGHCLKASITSIGENSQVPDNIKELLKIFKPETIGELCTCRFDKCNAEEGEGGEGGGEGSGEGESSGVTLRIGNTVLIMSFTLVIVTKFLNE